MELTAQWGELLERYFRSTPLQLLLCCLKCDLLIQQVEKDRQQSYGELNSTIKHIQIGQQTLQQETHNLVQALRRPEVRGQWGRKETDEK